MKTLLFIASLANIGGGGEVYLASVLRHLDRSRYRPLVLLPGEGSLRAALEPMEVEVLVIESAPGWLNPPKAWYHFLSAYPERVRGILDLIRSRGVDLVHTNSSTRLEGALAARLAGIPNVHVAHTRYQPEQTLWQRFPPSREGYARLIGELSVRVVAVSKTVLGELTPPLPESQVRMIHNGLEWQAFDRAMSGAETLRSELGLDRDCLLVTAVGRMDPEKGFDTFIEAVGRVAGRLPKAHFLLVGGGDDPAFARRLSEMSGRLGLSGRVHFLGYRSDVPRLLAASDIFVLSSRNEGGPYVLLEALAAGCPAVATRCGGFVEDVVLPGQTGELVDVNDPDGMASAIVALAGNPGARRMGEVGRDRVRGEFDARTTVEALMAIYEEALAAPVPPAGSPSGSLFLQSLSELGSLGLKTVELEARIARLEGETRLVRLRPLRAALNRLLGRSNGDDQGF